MVNSSFASMLLKTENLHDPIMEDCIKHCSYGIIAGQFDTVRTPPCLVTLGTKIGADNRRAFVVFSGNGDAPRGTEEGSDGD